MDFHSLGALRYGKELSKAISLTQLTQGRADDFIGTELNHPEERRILVASAEPFQTRQIHVLTWVFVM